MSHGGRRLKKISNTDQTRLSEVAGAVADARQLWLSEPVLLMVVSPTVAVMVPLMVPLMVMRGH
jgi:hypothetical protein